MSSLKIHWPVFPEALNQPRDLVQDRLAMAQILIARIDFQQNCRYASLLHHFHGPLVNGRDFVLKLVAMA